MILEHMPRTDWFYCSVLPEHIGWYEADYGLDAEPCMRWWDGAWWQMRVPDENAESGHRMAPCLSFGTQDRHQWRGLVDPPEVSQAALAEELSREDASDLGVDPAQFVLALEDEEL